MILEITFKEKCLTFGILSLLAIIAMLQLGGNIFADGVIFFIFIYLCRGDNLTLIYAVIKTFPRDCRGIIAFIKLNFVLMKWERQQQTVAKIFKKRVKQHPNKLAFLMDNVKLTFQEVDDISDGIASYFKQRNYKSGDTVSLFMEANPYYPCIWLGLSKIGVCTALINTNLSKTCLLHCIRISYCKGIIVGSELLNVFDEISNEDGVKTLDIYQYCQKRDNNNLEYKIKPGSIDLNLELSKSPLIDFSQELQNGHPKDSLLYIYTSGTTGLPKAAVIPNLRYLFMAMGTKNSMRLLNDDVMYSALPIYHTAGGMVGVGNTLVNGITLAMRSKFSASNFWPDCIRYNCTVAQYIGEICRYLLSTPEKPTDRQHNVRLMFGNGLRPQIWLSFMKRFNIERIGELYGSTEGISNLANIDNTIGAVGFVPRLAEKFYPVTLIRCKEGTNEPIRNKNGLCVKCELGEPGLFIGKINATKAISSFSGYVDKEATKKKVLANVFKKGDFYFNSGDILSMDIFGNFYFKDRLGDTFRWKGENVSTTEVEAIISNIVGLHDCIAYGVEIPYVEGKGGMIAIVDINRTIDIKNLSLKIKEQLPFYARPIFLRIIEKVPITATFKLVKTDLQSDGFDIKTKINDIVYILSSDGFYRPFTENDYEHVINGTIRL